MKKSAAFIAPLAMATSLPFFLENKTEESLPQKKISQIVPAPPNSLCFAPGTDPEIIAKHAVTTELVQIANSMAAQAANSMAAQTDPQFAFQIQNHWTTTATNGSSQSSTGDPVVLTWGIANDGTPINPAGNIDGESSDSSSLRSRLAEIYGGSATGPADSQPWFNLFEQVFENLSAETGLTFVYEPNDDNVLFSNLNEGIIGRRPDIRIGGHPLDGNANVLAYNFFPSYGEMVIDTNDSFFNNTNNNSRILRNVVGHEVGHGLGLSHVCPADGSKLMEPSLNTSFDGLQFDDIYSLQRNYGDAQEKSNSALSNDSFSLASPLTLDRSNLVLGPLSIDDDSDIDFYAIDLQGGDRINVSITPSTESYLEGPQNNNGTCSNGTTFDSSTRHNLSLALFDPNEVQLALADTQPAGTTESLNSITVPSTGTYYIRVDGDSTDEAQIYELEVAVQTSPTALNVLSITQTAELFAGQNGVPDPMETVEYTVVLENIGSDSALNVNATLTGPAEFVPIDVTENLGTLASQATASFPLTFALNAECGEVVPLTLTFTSDNGNDVNTPLEIMIGRQEQVLSENFDSAVSLPEGWQSETVGAGTGWATDQPVNPVQNSIFAPNLEDTGESILISPVIGPLFEGSTLTFEHLYNTESSWDGGVLEIAINNGPWTDIIDAGGSFEQGGYNRRLNNSSHDLGGRDAWTGNSGAFVRTEVLLPASVDSQQVQLRWRLAHDFTVAEVGWNINTVSVNSLACDEADVTLSLSSNDSIASEFILSDSAELTIQSSMVMSEDFPIRLSVTGSATSGIDFTSLSDLILEANNDTLTVAINAFEDSLAEGPESFTVGNPSGDSSVTFTINDSPFGDWVTSNLGSTLAQDADDDPDGDGLRNLEEYLLGSNPLERTEIPSFNSILTDDTLRLTLPVAAPPADVLITPFSSPDCLLYTSPSPRDQRGSRMPSSA